MLYKVSSPDSLHDQSSNDSGIDGCYRRSHRSPLAGEVPSPAGDCSQPSPSSRPLCLLRPSETTAEGAEESQAGSKNLIDTLCQKKYLGVRVRQPVRDLLRSYRIARGEDARDRQLDAAWKSNNLRRRVVRETVHGHPYTTKRNIQKKTSTFPPRNFEELFEDLVEVLETDLKQGPSQTVLSISEMDFQVGYCTGCPVSFPASNTGNQELQTHQGNLHHLSSHFSKGDSTFPDLVSINPKPPSHLEPVALNFSPGQLTVFTDEHCGNTSDEECQPCYAQNVTGQSLPCSPSTEADWFSQAELNAIQNCKAPHIESKHLPDTSQQQHSPNDSALSFFQFQLRYVEDYLCTVSMQEILSVDKNGNTMLHNAVIQGKRALAYSLACRTANVGRIDAKDSRGRTALHLAAERNQHLVVSDLISLGAQINGRDYLGKTPVHLCAESGFLRVLHVIEKTLKNGTNVHIDAVDNNLLTPLHCAVLAHAAAVKEFGISGMNGDTKRFLTLRKEQLLDGMRSLLRMGSSLSMQDLNGQSAIDYAEEVNDTEVLNFLYGYFDRMKAAHHEEFIPSGVLDVMDQNAELKELVSGGQLLPCDIFLQTSVGAQ
ncbi:NF-kappa-B inhibitor zeta [Scyliorhinus torazame]|uniref:NF-kappa-B inhibitor zeta n=1 Tax=Scyliorhinus torazame TaxID=75743 RepID=UPI003B59CC91